MKLTKLHSYGFDIIVNAKSQAVKNLETNLQYSSDVLSVLWFLTLAHNMHMHLNYMKHSGSPPCEGCGNRFPDHMRTLRITWKLHYWLSFVLMLDAFWF